MCADYSPERLRPLRCCARHGTVPKGHATRNALIIAAVILLVLVVLFFWGVFETGGELVEPVGNGEVIEDTTTSGTDEIED